MWPFKAQDNQEIARLRNTVARLDAHVAAVHLIVEQLLLRTNKEDRDMIVDQIKGFVAQPSHEPTSWITEEHDKKKFNDTLSGILQLFIERKEYHGL
jgi:hypothetical protein